MEQTVEYLNATMANARFYAIELVRFAATNFAAFESRTVLKPAPQSGVTKAVASTNEALFLDTVADPDYRETLRQLLAACTGLGLKLNWGTRGPSIRIRTPDRTGPLTVAWLYAPGVSGWNGLLDLNLGYDPGSATATPSAQAALEQYAATVQTLAGSEPVKPNWLRAFRLPPAAVVEHQHRLAELLAQLVQQVGAKG